MRSQVVSGKDRAMAEALKTFVKAFCREFSGVPECQVLASYDNAVKSKYDASRV